MKKRIANGLGTLYKRTADGDDVQATSKRPGVFWLKFYLDGKRKRVRLEVDGKPVRDLETARKEQRRMRAPFLTGDKVETLRQIEAEIGGMEQRLQEERSRANPPLRIAEAWRAFETSAILS